MKLMENSDRSRERWPGALEKGISILCSGPLVKSNNVRYANASTWGRQKLEILLIVLGSTSTKSKVRKLVAENHIENVVSLWKSGFETNYDSKMCISSIAEFWELKRMCDIMRERSQCKIMLEWICWRSRCNKTEGPPWSDVLGKGISIQSHSCTELTATYTVNELLAYDQIPFLLGLGSSMLSLFWYRFSMRIEIVLWSIGIEERIYTKNCRKNQQNCRLEENDRKRSWGWVEKMCRSEIFWRNGNAMASL